MADYKDIKYDFSGANLTALNATQLTSGTTPDARYTTLPAVSGANLTSLTATNLSSGTVPTARLGSGTASSSTVLYGDQTYKAEPGLTGWSTDSGSNDSLVPASASAGIYLGVAAATAANLLDDYEEGTFTPTITSSGSDPTQSYATQVGHYVKIGNLVQVQGYVQTAASGVSGGSGTDCFVDALPFTSKNTTNQRSGMSIGYASTWGTTRGVPTNAAIHPNQTRMYLKVQNNASNILSTVLTQVSAADVTNGTSVIFGGAYHSE